MNYGFERFGPQRNADYPGQNIRVYFRVEDIGGMYVYEEIPDNASKADEEEAFAKAESELVRVLKVYHQQIEARILDAEMK
jgi:hypothetical protein